MADQLSSGQRKERMMEVGEYYRWGHGRLAGKVVQLRKPVKHANGEGDWWAWTLGEKVSFVSGVDLQEAQRVTCFDGTPYEEPAFQGGVGEYWRIHATDDNERRLLCNGRQSVVVQLVDKINGDWRTEDSARDLWWWSHTGKHLRNAVRVQGFSGEPYVGDVQDDGPQVPEVGSMWFWVPSQTRWEFADTSVAEEDGTLYLLFRNQNGPNWLTLDEFSRHMVPYKPDMNPCEDMFPRHHVPCKTAPETQTARRPQVGDVYLVPSTGDTMTVCQSTEKSIRLHGPESQRSGRYRYVFRPSHFENHLTDGLFVLADRSQLIRDKLAALDAKRAREQATHWDPYGGLL